MLGPDLRALCAQGRDLNGLTKLGTVATAEIERGEHPFSAFVEAKLTGRIRRLEKMPRQRHDVPASFLQRRHDERSLCRRAQEIGVEGGPDRGLLETHGRDEPGSRLKGESDQSRLQLYGESVDVTKNQAPTPSQVKSAGTVLP